MKITKTTKVNSATKVECTDALLDDVEVFDYDDEIFYLDADGAFGEPDEYITLGDIKRYWNDESENDPVLLEFESFDDWWTDTQQNYRMEEVPVTNEVVEQYNAQS